MKEIKYRIKKIETSEFAILDSKFDELRRNIRANLRLGFGVKNINDNSILCITEFFFLQDDQPFIKLKIFIIFAIEENSWKDLVNTEENSLMLPLEFANKIASHTVDTARGILHTKTEGSAFNKFIMPAYDISNIVNQDENFLKLTFD